MVLERAAACNFDLLDELCRALHYGRDDAFRVGLWGSTIVKGAYQRAQLTRLMKDAYPHAQIVIAERNAAEGAVLWALERLNNR